MTVTREVVNGLYATITRYDSGLWWCKLKLPIRRYERSWVCCPGTTKHKAIANALKQARIYERKAA